MGRRRYVLIDRDGTLIVNQHYLSDPEGVVLIDGVAEALARLRRSGLGILVVTNQSGIGRGYFDEARLQEIHERLHALLGERGVALDGIYHCPHGPDDGCECRKPSDGLVRRAAAQHDLEPSECFVVGDTQSDIDLGKTIGATTFLVRTGDGRRTLSAGGMKADYTVGDLSAAVDRIIGLLDSASVTRSNVDG